MRHVDGVRLLEYETRVDFIVNQQREGESVFLTVTQETILLVLGKPDLFVIPHRFVNIVGTEPLRLIFVINMQVVRIYCYKWF